MFENYGKRVLSFLMALIMVVSMVPSQVFATDIEEDHEHCEVCGQHDCICPPEEAAHVHDFVAGEVVSPTCDKAGYTVYTCAGCGAVENRDEVAATGAHEFAAGEVVFPTCNKAGYTVYTCAGCGAVENRDEVAATGAHEFAAGEVVSPTCDKAGYTVYTCAGCGAVENRDEVAATGAHEFAAGEVVSPTCDKAGYTVYTCSVCGETENRDATPATGEHDFVAGTPVEATCEEKGYTPYTCTGCGAVEQRDVVEALGHAYETKVVEPTAEAQGYTEYTCTVCGDTYKDDFTDFVTEPEKTERQIPAGWTDEMKEIQEFIEDEIYVYWLEHYEFQMPDQDKFAPVVEAWIAEEDVPAELEAEWAAVHAQLENIVLNKMNANERENAVGSVKQVEDLMVGYYEAGMITEEQAKDIYVFNPVYLVFADLANEYGVAPVTLDALTGHSDTNIGLAFAHNHNWACNDTSKTKWTASETTITGQVTGGSRVYGAVKFSCSTTLTIQNNLASEANLYFKYSLTNGGSLSGGAISGTSGTYGPTKIASGGTITITVTSQNGDSNITTLSITDIALTEIKPSIAVTFVAPSNGSYTVTPAGGSAQTIAADTILSNEDGFAYELKATAATDYRFVGWIDGNNSIRSTSSTFTLQPAEDMSIKPFFVKDGGEAAFAIGTVASLIYSEKTLGQGTDFTYYQVSNTHLYDDLGDAIAAAQNGTSKAIVLLNDGTITGNYEIPSGVTLLIPYDAANTLNTTTPLCAGEVGVPTAVGSITAYRTLTMASGSSITVAKGGAINVNAKVFGIGGSDVGGGSPLGSYGYIKMQANSNITIQSGGALYCYGYIGRAGADNSGSVLVQNGGTVYEIFQFEDFRGGDMTSSMANDSTYGIFPLNSYYVQNVLVPMTLESGATEYSHASLYMQSALFGTSVKFISGSGAMFNLTSGSVTKAYDYTNDRTVITANGGNMAINNMSMGIAGITLNSATYDLPINGNMTIRINGGSTIALNQDVALLPGAEIYIAEGAFCQLNSGCNLFVYDLDQWGTYVSSRNNKMAAQYFVPNRVKTRTEADLKDAYFQVSGTILASGNAYTTEGGAAITGKEGGKVTMNVASSDVVTYQVIQSSGNTLSSSEKVSIPLTTARLQNADKTYTDPAKICPTNGTTYTYTNGVWVPLCNTVDGVSGCVGNIEDSAVTCKNPMVCIYCGTTMKTKDHTPGAAPTCETDQTCTVCGAIVTAKLNHKNGGDAVNAVTPSCYSTEAGHKAYYTCKDCGEPFEDAACTTPIADLEKWKAVGGAGHIAIPDHVYGDAVTTTKAPTCTQSGTGYKICRTDGCNKRQEVTIDPTGHPKEKVNKTEQKDATCTDAGLEAYYFCGACQTYYATGTISGETVSLSDPIGEELGVWGIISAIGHNTENDMTADAVASTCTVNGTAAYWYCSNCATYYSDAACTSKIENLEEWKTGDGQLALAAHTEVTVAKVPATCVAPGTTAGTKCSVCQQVQSGCDPISQLPHVGIEVPGKAATCTEPGWEDYYRCNLGCGKFYEDETCTTETTEDAWKSGTGKIKALGHHLVLIEAVAADCKNNIGGSRAYYQCAAGTACDCGTCDDRTSFCGAVYEDADGTTPIENLETWKVIPPDHTPGEAVKENENIETGVYESVTYCSICETEISRITVTPGASVAHTNLVQLPRVEPTCYTEGLTAGAYCKDGIDGGCTACMEAGETYMVAQETIPMKPHTVNATTLKLDWDSTTMTVTASATCLVEECKEPITETVAIVNMERKDATCESVGVVTYTSAEFTDPSLVAWGVGGVRYGNEYIPKLNHNWDTPVTFEWSEDNAICTATQICANNTMDGCTRNEIVNSYAVSTAATCEAEGYTTYTADFTQSWVKNDPEPKVVPGDEATGHTWTVVGAQWSLTGENKTCTVALECDRDAQHTKTVVLAVTAETLKEDTCTQAGEILYTAAFTAEGKDTMPDTLTKREYPDTVQHIWSDISYTWGANNATCTASRTCSVDASHVESETVTATADDGTADCTTDGVITHTAAFTTGAFASKAATETTQQFALGHKVDCVAELSPTCKTTGTAEHYKCEACGKLFLTNADAEANKAVTADDLIMRIVDHSYTVYVYNNDASCTKAGTKTASCDYNCGETDTINDTAHPQLEHTFTNYVYNNDATCQKAGTETAECDTCDTGATDTRNSEDQPQLPCAYTKEEILKPATCTAEGIKELTCVNGCNGTKTEPIPALGHAYAEQQGKAATCYEEGWKNYYQCSGDDGTRTYCNQYFANENDTTSIALTTWQNGDGKLEKIAHDYVSVVTAPTCLEQGYTTHTCKNCPEDTKDHSYVDSYTDALQHKYDTGVIKEGDEPTCTVAGKMTFTCQNDCCTAETEDHTRTESVAALGHSLVPVEGKATSCDEPGYNACYQCAAVTRSGERSYCGYYFASETDTAADATHIATDASTLATWRITSAAQGGGKIEQRVCVDADYNHECDYEDCTKTVGAHVDVNPKDHICDTYGESCAQGRIGGECSDADTDTDHNCDYCGKTIGKHVFVNGKCNCGYVQDLEVTITIKAEGQNDHNVPVEAIKYGNGGNDFTITLDLNAMFNAPCYTIQSVSANVGGADIESEYEGNTLTIAAAALTGNVEIVVNAHQAHKTDAQHTTVTIKDATCEQPGEKKTVLTCVNCGTDYDSYTEVIPAKNHDWVESYVAPTFDADGYTLHHCKNDPSHDYEVIDDGTKLIAVARIGTTRYQTLEEAIEAAGNRDTIELLTKCVVEGTQVWDKNITILLPNDDVVGYNYGLIIKDDLTIKDGTIVISSYYGIGVQPTAKLTIDGGTFELDRGVANDYLIGSWGETVINGGEFVGQYNCVNGFAGSLTINGGEFETDAFDSTSEYASEDVLAEDGVAQVKGGTFSKEVDEIFLADGYCQVEGRYGFEVAAHEHGEAFRENENAASCEADGSYDLVTKCERCDAELSRVTTAISATGHTVEVVDGKDADCLNPGYYQAYHCTVCGGYYAERNTENDRLLSGKIDDLAAWQTTGAGKINALGHELAHTEKVPAGCETSGVKEYWQCERCAAAFADEQENTPIEDLAAWKAEDGEGYIVATGHDYTSEVTTKPTCTTDGVRTYTCQNDNSHIYTETEPKLNHNYVVTYTWNEKRTVCTASAVCENDPYHKATMTAVASVSVTTAAGCETDGAGIRTAAFTANEYGIVDQTEPVVIPATDHSFTNYTSDGNTTCTEDGTKTATCDNGCGKTDTVANTGAAKGHQKQEIPAAPATCTNEGIIGHYQCGVCLVRFYDEACTQPIEAGKHIEPALQHKYTTEVIDPDCENQGYTIYTCIRGDHSYNADFVAKLGHDYTQEGGTIVTLPTCTEDGYTTYACSRCEESHIGDSIPATRHAYVLITGQSADCTQAGWKSYYKCKNSCGLYYDHVLNEDANWVYVLIGADEAAVEAWKNGAGKIEPYGHTSFQDVPGKKQDCDHAGYLASFTCRRCDLYFTENEDSEKVLIGNGSEDAYTAWISEGGDGYLKPNGHKPSEVKIENAIAPKCEVNGSHDEVIYCTVCTAELSSTHVVDPKTGHPDAAIVHYAAKNPDCTNTGLTAGEFCSACEKWLVEQTVIKANGHTEVIDPAVDSTCTATGLTEGKHCSECGEKLVVQTVVPKKSHNHSVSVSITPASCVVDGSQIMKCATCDDTITNILKAPGHNSNGIIEAVAPTCTETGLTEGKKCTACNTTQEEPQIVPATGHLNVTATAQVDTSCKASGLKAYYFCDDCDTYYATSDSEDHKSLSDKIGNAKALETWKLTVGDKGGKIEKLPHTEETIPAITPNCTDDGMKAGVKCSVCGDILVEPVVDPAKGHTEVPDKEKLPTCTETGLTAGVHCSVCTTVLVPQDEVPATGHRSVVVTAQKDATCLADGIKAFYYCVDCATFYATRSEEDETILSNKIGGPADLANWKFAGGKINKLDHTIEILSAVAPSCEETGLTKGEKCSVCKTVLIPQDEVPATGHTAVIDNKVDPTCTETGLTEGKHCSVCTKVLEPQEVVPAKGHTPELVKGLAAKCEADGWKDYYQCKECKAFFEDEAAKLPIEDLDAWKIGAGKLAQIGHAWDEGRETTLATCTTTGIKTYTCGNCNGTKPEVIPELGHEPEVHPAQHPTYYSAGWHEYETCKRCDHNTFVGIPALGEPSVKTFEEFMTSLQYLEGYANDYAKANPGKDPMLLLIKYVRTGVDRYNSGSWNIMAGYEDEAFAEYVMKQEEAYNKAAPTVDGMINVTGIKNIHNFKLPNGDSVDFGHMFGTMDITYHNKTSINHADVAGWAGDLVDLLSTADRHDVTGTVNEMIVEIGEKYLNHSIAGESDQFSQTDMYGDLDGYYFMNELIGEDYENGMLYELMSNYFVASLDDEQRAGYFLKNRLGGVTSRSDIRDAVFREYTGNQVIATLEGTREFKQADVSDMRKACCYVFADYLCKLAGDYTELGDLSYLTVFSSETSVLAPGITQQINKATTSDGKQVVYYTATGDVISPYVSVYANYKDNNPGAGWGMQRVRDQANAAQAKYGNPESEHYIPNYTVIATINGAGYNMSTGEPSGVLMMGGVEYHAPNGGGFFGIRKDGTACLGSDTEYYALKEKGELSEAIAIFGTTLIKNGKLNVSTNDFNRASRTAIGYTKTGKVVFMAMDGRQEPVSCGGSMAEIAQVMLEAGCVWAVNLDGGGSTTYLARQEGDEELSLVSSPSDGFERSVSTSWIMVSTAPSSTAFDHAALNSDVRHMTIGATVQVTAAGVSATGNSVDLPEGAVWAVSDPSIASISADGVVTGLANGTFDVQLKLGDEVIGTRTMYVVIPDAVYFTKENMNAVYGEPVDLPVAALYEGKSVAITENDAYFTLSNDEAGTTEGYTFIGKDTSGIKNVKIFAHAVNNPDATSGSMGINMFKADEATFDFENADGGDRMLAWKRVVSNATTADNVTYTAVDKEKPMVTEYTFGMDMTQIPMPEKLTDLVFMLPGADVEGNNSAWDFLLQLAERVSVLTEVKATINIDPDFDVDCSQMSVNCEYFNLEKTEINPETNQLILSLRWKDQTKAIDPNTANPLVILAGIKLTPKADAAWSSKDQLDAVHTGNISYDIYLRANALYSFASKPENQEAYDLYPFVNEDVIINGAPESGGHFADTYKEFSDQYTLNKGLKNGWFFENGGYAFYEDGEKYTGIRKAGSYYYDFGTDGINIGQTKYTGMFQIEGVNHYAKDGMLSGGWYINGDDKYYFDENGKAVDGEIILDEVKMVFDNGLHVGGYSGFLKKNDGKTYYYQNGSMTYGWVEVGDDLYHFNTDNGTMTTGTHVIPDDEARAKGAYYDFADDGRTLRGYFNGFGYYYWAGLPKRDAWVKEGSDPDPDAWYHTNNTGHFVTSSGTETYKLELNGVTYDAVKIAYDGVVYVFDDHTGKLLLGSMVLEDGFWYYYWAGEPVNDGWFEFEGETFYAFENGKLASGVQTIDGEPYMFTDRGALIKDGITLSITMNDDRTQMTIKTNRIYKDMTRVSMAIWSDENGQDDLKWFNATHDGNGVWTVVVDPLCQYRSIGRYQIHAYECEENGQLKEILVNTIYDLAEIGHATGEPVKQNVVAPNCIQNGGYDLVTTCEYCKQIINTEHVVDPAVPNAHTYDDKVDGTCNVCGVDRAKVEVRKKHNMLRMYNPYSGEHFYTGSEEERDNLVAAGWKYEGVAFTFPANTGAPVYRLYDPATGEHLYTMDEAEMADLMAKGWNYENIAFNSGYDTEALQHRLHNPYTTVGGYHFTFSEEEMQNLIAAGWIYQGIGWYSCFK